MNLLSNTEVTLKYTEDQIAALMFHFKELGYCDQMYRLVWRDTGLNPLEILDILKKEWIKAGRPAHWGR